jgi:hypothetical protein
MGSNHKIFFFFLYSGLRPNVGESHETENCRLITSYHAYRLRP